MKKTVLVLTILSLLLLVSGYCLFTFIKATIIPNLVIMTLGAGMLMVKTVMFILMILVIITGGRWHY